MNNTQNDKPIRFKDFININSELLTEMSQIYDEIPKDFLTSLLSNNLLTNRSSKVYHKEEFSYIFTKTTILIFLTNNTDVLGGAFFELYPSKINNQLCYEEQIVSSFEEFYKTNNNLMERIYKFLKELMDCVIISDNKHSIDSFNQWKKFKNKYNIKIYNTDTAETLNYKDEYFCKDKKCRKYRFLWL